MRSLEYSHPHPPPSFSEKNRTVKPRPQFCGLVFIGALWGSELFGFLGMEKILRGLVRRESWVRIRPDEICFSFFLVLGGLGFCKEGRGRQLDTYVAEQSINRLILLNEIGK